MKETRIEERPFEVTIPAADGEGIAEKILISVPMEWDEDLEEWLLTPEAQETIENTRARHMGLLLPHEMKELRERLGLPQAEVGRLLQIGAKTWTRWETGKQRPSRSQNLLLRSLYDGEITVDYLRSAGRQTIDWRKVISVDFRRRSSREPISMDHLLACDLRREESEDDAENRLSS